jgi:glucokinase
MGGDRWAVGVDLGGTKVEVARVGEDGRIRQRVRHATDVDDGADRVIGRLVASVREMIRQGGSGGVGVGVGVAGQVEAVSGTVRFAPNLKWQEVALGDRLRDALEVPVAVTNDVRAVTWGEWLHGAGVGCDDLLCVFVGTGIGGGVVSGGRMLTGHRNSAGEFGHMTVDLEGPECTCGNRGCLESLAGGWAIARAAREAVTEDRTAGAVLLELAGGQLEEVTARTVADAFHRGDPLAARLVNRVTEALAAGAAGLVNAFNPCRLILGGGVVEGLPGLVERVERRVAGRALAAAVEGFQVLPAQLGNDAGVIGAAAFAMRTWDPAGDSRALPASG